MRSSPMSPRLQGPDIPPSTRPNATWTPAHKGRWRCLIKGCWDYGKWQPVVTGHEGREHYMTEHYHPTHPAPGTHPDEIRPDGRLRASAASRDI